MKFIQLSIMIWLSLQGALHAASVRHNPIRRKDRNSLSTLSNKPNLSKYKRTNHTWQKQNTDDDSFTEYTPYIIIVSGLVACIYVLSEKAPDNDETSEDDDIPEVLPVVNTQSTLAKAKKIPHITQIESAPFQDLIDNNTKLTQLIEASKKGTLTPTQENDKSQLWQDLKATKSQLKDIKDSIQTFEGVLKKAKTIVSIRGDLSEDQIEYMEDYIKDEAKELVEALQTKGISWDFSSLNISTKHNLKKLTDIPQKLSEEFILAKKNNGDITSIKADVDTLHSSFEKLHAVMKKLVKEVNTLQGNHQKI